MGRKPPWGPGIQTPSYILSPLDSGPQFYGLECPFLFLLSFLSGHSETPAGNRRRFFINSKFIDNYFSNTENSSQCALPTNWSIGINVFNLYPPCSKMFESRRHVIGLHET